MTKALFTLRFELDLGARCVWETACGFPLPAFARTGFAGMTDKRQSRHSREGGNPWLSGNRSLALHLTLQRDIAPLTWQGGVDRRSRRSL